MSGKATKAVYANGLLMLRVLASAPADIDTTELRILLAIASRANDEATDAWPDNAEITGYAACSERTLSRRLKSLLRQGWLTRSRKYVGAQRWRWNYTLSKTPPSNTTVASSPWRSSSTPPSNTSAPRLDATREYEPGTTVLPILPGLIHTPQTPPSRRPSAGPSADAHPAVGPVPVDSTGEGRTGKPRQGDFPSFADYQLVLARWYLDDPDPNLREVAKEWLSLAGRKGNAA
jgi:hypothetical protein